MSVVIRECIMTEPREQTEIESVIVAAIEKHARGDVLALARGILVELYRAGFEIRDLVRQSGPQ